MTNRAVASEALSLPYLIWRTKHRFNDDNASDMRCGDLDEKQLKKRYGLYTVAGIDPFTSERVDFPISNYATIRVKLSHSELITKLFNELRNSSSFFTFYGSRELFIRLTAHLQENTGYPFSDLNLNREYEKLIIEDDSEDRSSLLKIKKAIESGILWDKNIFPEKERGSINLEVQNSVLPKFNRWVDCINGLGMSVHEVYATEITLESLTIKGGEYTAKIHYHAQDDFGLDDEDIMNFRYHNLTPFQIWFILQRWKKFCFKPFFVNMWATVEIKGKRK